MVDFPASYVRLPECRSHLMTPTPKIGTSFWGGQARAFDLLRYLSRLSEGGAPNQWDLQLKKNGPFE